MENIILSFLFLSMCILLSSTQEHGKSQQSTTKPLITTLATNNLSASTLIPRTTTEETDKDKNTERKNGTPKGTGDDDPEGIKPNGGISAPLPDNGTSSVDATTQNVNSTNIPSQYSTTVATTVIDNAAEVFTIDATDASEGNDTEDDVSFTTQTLNMTGSTESVTEPASAENVTEPTSAENVTEPTSAENVTEPTSAENVTEPTSSETESTSKTSVIHELDTSDTMTPPSNEAITNSASTTTTTENTSSSEEHSTLEAETTPNDQSEGTITTTTPADVTPSSVSSTTTAVTPIGNSDVTPESRPTNQDSGSNSRVALGIAIPVLLVLSTVLGFFCYKKLKKSGRGYITLDDFGTFEGMNNPNYDGEL